MPQQWRDKIQTSMLINRLERHVNGELELSSTQVAAANILLKKSLPDIASVTVAGDPDNPIHTVQKIVREIVRPAS